MRATLRSRPETLMPTLPRRYRTPCPIGQRHCIARPVIGMKRIIATPGRSTHIPTMSVKAGQPNRIIIIPYITVGVKFHVPSISTACGIACRSSVETATTNASARWYRSVGYKNHISMHTSFRSTRICNMSATRSTYSWTARTELACTSTTNDHPAWSSTTTGTATRHSK